MNETRRAKKFHLPDEIGIFVVLLLVAAVFCILSSSFRTYNNMLSLLLNGAVIAFLALGQTLVLLTGGIDLSTGSNIAMTGVLCAYLMNAAVHRDICDNGCGIINSSDNDRFEFDHGCGPGIFMDRSGNCVFSASTGCAPYRVRGNRRTDFVLDTIRRAGLRRWWQ
jgi:ribose/xylose/arabinose/galactoside ABC-type transport system permease subunit